MINKTAQKQICLFALWPFHLLVAGYGTSDDDGDWDRKICLQFERIYHKSHFEKASASKSKKRHKTHMRVIKRKLEKINFKLNMSAAQQKFEVRKRYYKNSIYRPLCSDFLLSLRIFSLCLFSIFVFPWSFSSAAFVSEIKFISQTKST